MTQPNKAKKTAEDWAKRVSESGGRMHFTPESMKKEVEDFLSSREEYMRKFDEFRRYEAEFTNNANNFWYKLRVELDKAGAKGAFMDEIGLNEQALQEGVRIFNLFPKMNR